MAKLYFKYGPMKCGKTTDIIKTYYNYKEKDMNVLIMKPGDDKKAGSKIQNRAGAEFTNLDKSVANQLLYLNILLEADNEMLATRFTSK